MNREPVVVDARGERCPQPVILLARAARAIEAGSLVTVLSTDPAAGGDIAAWCRMRGHTLVSQSAQDQPLAQTSVLTSIVRVEPIRRP